MCRESKGLINVPDKLGRSPLLVGLMAGAGLEAITYHVGALLAALHDVDRGELLDVLGDDAVEGLAARRLPVVLDDRQLLRIDAALEQLAI